LIKIIQSILDEKRMMIENGRIREKKDFLDLLFEMNDKKGEKLVDGDIIEFLLTLLFAGHESTAVTMLWSIIYLTQNPLCLKKATVNHIKFVTLIPFFFFVVSFFNCRMNFIENNEKYN
jgi:cytochrome P450